MTKKSEIVWRAQFDIIGLSESQIEVLGDRITEYVQGLDAELIFDADLFIDEDWDEDDDDDWLYDDLDDED